MNPLIEIPIATQDPATKDALDWRRRLAVHRRDIELFERLFSNWTRGRMRQTNDAHQTLDAIDAQLARLEQAVRMTVVA